MSKTWGRMLGICMTMVGGALLAAQAQAQCTPPATTNGPDVIVGDITGPSNYVSVGAYDALSLGTYSCNIGNSPVGWHASTNNHPVIGGALFRLKTVSGASHFEQVGTSWLKHGFFALSNSLCCTGCQGDASGATLGVHCSDPYTSGRNGSQSGLGPRWQVNPHTGFFPYPPFNTPSGGNNGRLQVKLTELEVTGGAGAARYFGEAMYVTPDDAAAANQNNNATYVEVGVSGGPSDFNFSFIGSAFRSQPAINAWQKADPTVTLRPTQVTGDGLVVLGYKTTSLGGGQYHYEYAVYNMNVDAAFGTFTVPVGAGVTVTNIGFHDFDYVGGDGINGINQDGTDWPGSVVGNTVQWATTPFNTNANANAIRWQGLYNFRFDANAAPTAGSVTATTFKGNSPVAISADVPGGGSSVGTSYCFGDGTGPTMCPCLNFGGPGNGCGNSANANGAVISGTGTTTPDTVVLTTQGELPSALTIFLQGDMSLSTPVIFGAGLRCAAGNLKRIGVKNASSGSASYPQAGDPSITTQSANLGDPIPPGGTRYYTAYYRDPSTTFCPPATFNAAQGLTIVWN